MLNILIYIGIFIYIQSPLHKGIYRDPLKFFEIFWDVKTGNGISEKKLRKKMGMHFTPQLQIRFLIKLAQ